VLFSLSSKKYIFVTITDTNIMQETNILEGCWAAYEARKLRNGENPDCFSPEELWEFNYLVDQIVSVKPYLDQITIILAIREGMRRTVAPRPRHHFVDLVLRDISTRENQWKQLLDSMDPSKGGMLFS
jgi:hypothetical protein